MNRGEIRDEIRRLVRDVDDTNQRWTDAVLNERIDQSNWRISSITKCIKLRITDGITINVSEYDLPDYVVEIDSVMYLNSNAEWIPLTKKSEKELDLQNSNWRSLKSSTIVNYYIRRNKVGLVPCPDFTRASAIRVDLSRAPDDMSADTDIPFEDEKQLYGYHNVICFDVAEKCMLDEGKVQEAAIYEAKTQQKIREMRSEIDEGTETRISNIYEKAREKTRRTS